MNSLIPRAPAVSPAWTCAYLTTHSNSWFQDLIASCRWFDRVTYPATVLGLREAPNPYGLRFADRADVTLVDTRWFKWLHRHEPGMMSLVFRRLESVSDAIVGVEAYDTFRLGAPPEMLDRCAGLLKSYGMYRDRDLYNYDVGPYFPGADWWSRTRPSARRYTAEQLSRLELSLPCFVGVDPRMRARFRRLRRGPVKASLSALAERGVTYFDALAPPRRREQAAFFVGSLSHVQRRDAVEALLEHGVEGTFGITDVPSVVFGLKHKGTVHLDATERNAIATDLERRGLRAERSGRLRMMRDLRSHGIVLAPVGYGELTFRHAEAWRAGAALVCQDISHAEIMFPVKNGVTARFCRPDLSDVVDVIHELAEDQGQRRRIAQAGHDAWKSWMKDPDSMAYDGLVSPLERVLGTFQPRVTDMALER